MAAVIGLMRYAFIVIIMAAIVTAGATLPGKFLPSSGQLLYTVDTEGGAQLRSRDMAHGITLTVANIYPQSPIYVSPDGQLIAYRPLLHLGGFDLAVLNSDGTNYRIFEEQQRSEYQLAWLPDNQHVLSISAFPYQVIVRNVFDGTSITYTRRMPDIFSSVMLSADGDYLAFAGASFGVSACSIYILHWQTNAQYCVQTNSIIGSVLTPIWSPDGEALFYWNISRGVIVRHWNTYNPTFDEVSNLGRLSHIAWSPDSRWLVLAQDNPLDLFLVDAEAGIESLVNLTQTTEGHERFPVWSPDERAIAFTSSRGGRLELYVMNPDGSNQRRLTYNNEAEMNLVWLP